MISADFLLKQYKRHTVAAKKKLDYFLGLSRLNGRQRVEEWEAMSTDPVLVGNEWHSVYRLKEGKRTVLISLNLSEN